jgi:hypothetical protein
MKLERIKLSEIVNPTPKQQKFLDLIDDYKYILYGGAMGGGKALPLVTKVCTPKGFVNLGNIHPGDIVFGKDGKEKVVTGETNIEARECFELHFSDGRKCIASDNHLWNVTISSSRIKDRIMTTTEILERLRNRKVSGKTYNWPLIELCEPVRYKKSILPFNPYVIGVILGDGGLTQGSIVVTTADEEIIENIKKEGFTVTERKSKYQYCIKGGTKTLPKNLRNKKSEEKEIPKEYLTASVDDRISLIQGLMDTDGYIDSRGHCSFSTSSRKLRDGFLELAWSLGFKASFQIKETGFLDNYVIHLAGKENCNLFRLKRKKNRVRKWNNGDGVPMLAIKDIIPVRCEVVKCIEVEDGFYITEDYVVTHNSYILRWSLVSLLMYWYATENLRNITVGLFCEDYPSLNDRHISKIEFEFPQWLGTLNKSSHEFIMNPKYGGGKIAMRNLDEPSKYACYSSDTEILVRGEGFVSVSKLKIGKECLSLHPENREMSWQKITKVHRYKHKGVMLKHFGRFGVSFCVTENHRMLYSTRRNPQLRFCEAKDLPKTYLVPRVGYWKGEKHNKNKIIFKSDGNNGRELTFDYADYLEFLGLYLAEGSVDKSRWSINISQTNKKNHKDISSLLDRMGVNWNYNGERYSFNNKALYLKLKRFGLSRDKFIPQGIKNLNTYWILFLWKGLMMGDGSRYGNNKYIYTTNSQKLNDDVSEIGLKLGYTPTCYVYSERNKIYPNGKVYKQGKFYHLTLTKRLKLTRCDRNTEKIKYNGVVYCPEVPPFHNILIRHRGRVMFCGQSAEFAAIAVDELTKNKEETFNFLRTRLRWPGIKEPKFLAGTNPGSIGHVWVRKKWMDGEFDPNEKEAHRFTYLPAKAEDNPHLDFTYLQILDSLPEKMRKAFKEGDWDIFAGQFFTEWKRDRNTCTPYQIPNYWQIFLGLDYGYAAPSCVHWGALDTLGRVIIYRELYGAGMTYTTLAKMIEKMTPKEERDRLIGNMVADPAIFRKEGYHKEGLEKDFVKSGSQEMMEATNGWLAFTRGNNDRINGWGVMREYMKAIKMGEVVSPRLIYFSTCKSAIRTIPALVHDESKVEDVDCYVAGTKVLTKFGVKNVEDIKVGELVKTPIGHKKVIKAGISGESDLVCSVLLTNGDILRGTANHKVATWNRGLVELRNLDCSDILIGKTISVKSIWKIKRLFTKVLFIASILGEIITSLMEAISKRDLLHCIGRYILITLEKFRKDIKYITKTITTITTPQATFLLSQNTNTHCTTIKSIYITQKERREDTIGIEVKREKHNLERMPGRCTKILQKENSSVEIVELLRKLGTLQRYYAKGVRNTKDFIKGNVPFVENILCKRKTEKGPQGHVHISAVGNFGKEKVYRLTIEDAHLYYANGILSTNTDSEDHAGDCDRYLLMEIHDRFSEKPREVKKIKTAGDIFESEMKIIQQRKLEQEHNIDWMSI